MIAEGFLVLPFSRRNKQHTGHHSAVPESLAKSGLLHGDGTAPDLSGIAADDGEGAGGPGCPEQVRVRCR